MQAPWTENVSDEMMVKESGKSAWSTRRFGARVKPELLIGRNGAAKDEVDEETLGELIKGKWRQKGKTTNFQVPVRIP